MTLVMRRKFRWWYGFAAIAMAASSLLAAASGTATAASLTATAQPTAAALQSARAALAGRLVPSTAVGIDPLTHHVVLTIASKATGTAGLLSAARRLGPMVRVERFPGAITTAAVGHILDGDGIVTSTGISCTLGFNVTGGFALTAGHCAVNRGPWFKAATGALFGPAVDAQIPGSDFGLLKDKGGLAQPGAIQAYDGTRIPVIGAANPYVGEQACKSGAATGITCGDITVLNVTVMYPDGSLIFGQVQTTICLQPGDSGGPLFDDSGNVGATALGLAASFIGNCSAGTFFYQPVVPALNFYGVQVLTG